MISMTEKSCPRFVACTIFSKHLDYNCKGFCLHFIVSTLQLRLILQTTKKGDKSKEDYISLMVQIANSLSLAGDKVIDKELALFILGGLGTEYDPLVTTITIRPGSETLLVDEIQGLLLNHEIKLSKHIALSLENSLLVNYVSKQKYNANSFHSL